MQKCFRGQFLTEPRNNSEQNRGSEIVVSFRKALSHLEFTFISIIYCGDVKSLWIVEGAFIFLLDISLLQAGGGGRRKRM